MSVKEIVLYVLVVLAIGLSVYSFISKPKLAYVESNEIIQKYNESKKVKEKLELETKSWQTNVQILKTELDSLQRIWLKENKSWTKAKLEEKRKEAAQKEEEFNRYSQAVQQKAAQREQELMGPVYADINKYINEYAEAHAYVYVFGTIQGNLVYADKATNITKDLIEFLNAQ